MKREAQDFSPAIYGLLATFVTAAFALAGAVAWWWIPIAGASVYASESFHAWQRRRS